MKTTLKTTLSIATSAILMPLAIAQDAPEPGQQLTLLYYFNLGGIWMYPLLLCSFGMIGITVFCFIQISKNKLMPPALLAPLRNYMANRQVGEAYQLCQTNPSTFTKVLSAALIRVNYGKEMYNKPAMEASAGEAIYHEETRLMFWVNLLNVFATIAPMLGLLGTVVGMIGAFEDLKAGKTEPNDLAGGIGVAMLTTAGGLIVGIPAMFFYFLFRGQLQGLMSEIQKNVGILLDVFSGELTAEGTRQSTGYTQAVPTVDPGAAPAAGATK
jgi:biopolymer transport protein ExbB